MICPYVYKITNIITEKFYIGVRYGHIKFNRLPKEDIGIYYKSSSTYILDDIAEYGEAAFIYEILYEYNDIDVCYWYEQLLIRENIGKENCVNRKYFDPDTGKFGKRTFGILHTAETKQKMSASLTGRRHTEETKQKIRDAVTGKTHSEETKQKMSAYWKNKPKPKEATQKRSKALTGRTLSAETKEKLRQAALLRWAANRDTNE